jgi:hypothetical protein
VCGSVEKVTLALLVEQAQVVERAEDGLDFRAVHGECLGRVGFALMHVHKGLGVDLAKDILGAINAVEVDAVVLDEWLLASEIQRMSVNCLFQFKLSHIYRLV